MHFITTLHILLNPKQHTNPHIFPNHIHPIETEEQSRRRVRALNCKVQSQRLRAQMWWLARWWRVAEVMTPVSLTGRRNKKKRSDSGSLAAPATRSGRGVTSLLL